MNTIETHSRQTLSRGTFLKILNAAIKSRSYRFARELAINWLSIFSGDLEVIRLLAKVQFGEGNRVQAVTLSERICKLDPEFRSAHEDLALYAKDVFSDIAAGARACAYALGTDVAQVDRLPEWAYKLREVREAVQAGLLQEAEEQIHEVLGLNLDLALPTVVHLAINLQQVDPLTINHLASIYHARWQDCLQFALALAQSQLDIHSEPNAVSLLHHCVANDAAGQVACRMWGANHRLISLWHDRMAIDLNMGIPSEVMIELGWNLLPAGMAGMAAVLKEGIYGTGQKSETTPATNGFDVETKDGEATTAPHLEGNSMEAAQAVAAHTPPPINASEPMTGSQSIDHQVKRHPGARDKRLEAIAQEFERLAKKLNRPGLAGKDGRFPVYVVFSTRSGLVRQYGHQTALVIENELKKLAEVMRKRSGWGAMVFLPDELTSTKYVGVEPLSEINPWKLKLALGDLDQSLAKKGAMIGSLLIVGGSEVVPFHQLPNPTEDIDEYVLSDNPYATLDSNYFIPEWQVGRLPGEHGPDAGLLLEQIRKLIENHNRSQQTGAWWLQILNGFRLALRLGEIRSRLLGKKSLPSFGYTAEVWRRASLAVFRPVGEGRSLLVSPPLTSGILEPKRITDASIGYYNLHGLPDTAEWYGQRDMTSPANGPDYPVAISVKDLVKNGKSPQIVFTEACYGGHIVDKTEQEAIALRFITIGSQAVIGSTCISYGSVTTPLIGADLLSYLFWKHLSDGHTAGEAFMKAKVDFANEMNRRQGFLDGEDQKTLISFVLYGDPFSRQDGAIVKNKGVSRRIEHPEIQTISEKQEIFEDREVVSSDVLREIKRMVEPYLPGIDDSVVTITQEIAVSSPMKADSTGSTVIVKNKQYGSMPQVVVTISKNVQVANHIHRHYARATLDQHSKVVKLAVSR